MGRRNLDRISISEFRAAVETVADMQRQRWAVVSHCRKCRLLMAVDLALIAKVRGPKASLWNKLARCKKIGCDGIVEFQAQIPGKVGYETLTAPWPESRPPLSESPPAKSSVSLARLAKRDGSIHISCYAPGCEPMRRRANWYGGTMKAAAASAKWGPDLTVDEIRERYRCPICKHRGKHIRVEVSTPSRVPQGASADWEAYRLQVEDDPFGN